MSYVLQQQGTQHKVTLTFGVFYGQRETHNGKTILVLRRHAKITDPETPSVIRFDGQYYHVELLGAPPKAGSTFATIKDIERAFADRLKTRHRKAA